MEEKRHILNVLQKVQTALKKNDVLAIKNLSNQVIHTASITQDGDVISIAVSIYALGKLMERDKYRSYKKWNSFYKNYLNCLDILISALRKDNIDKSKEGIECLRNDVQDLTGHLKDYIYDVFRKAKINKASRIYEHGISMEKTASILGISVWELAEYAGQTGIADVDLSITMPIRERIKIAEEVFK